MQIVGLYKEDGYKYIHENNFTGITVFKTNNMEVNFATHPVQGFQELNVNLTDKNGLDLWADWIQYAIRYTLEEMYGEENVIHITCFSIPIKTESVVKLSHVFMHHLIL